MGLRARLSNVVLGQRNEAGQREGGMAGLFRGGNGRMMNPVSAIGDRIGRNVAGRVNDWNTNRLENRHRQELIAQEAAGRPVMAERMPGPVSIPNPNGRSIEGNGSVDMTDAERQQQIAQFDRYKDDPNSIYFQGNRNAVRRSNSPMTDQVLGNPMASRHRSPTAELYRSHDVSTTSGSAFNDAVNYYKNKMQMRKDFEQ